jgi:thiopurine S-methyltransferase
MIFSKNYWEKQYKNGYTGWDIGTISTPMREYFDQLKNKDIKILIPGGGNGYEAEYLYALGFKNIYLLDWSELALKNFSERAADFPVDNLLCENFFGHEGKYELILEQTFFCAISPGDRRKYAEKIYELLNEKGKLAGLFFDCDFNTEGPPFGGTAGEYREYFNSLFEFRVFERCYNSIKPRAGREMFVILIKRGTVKFKTSTNS